MKCKIAIGILFVCLSASFTFAQLNIDQPFPFKDLIFPEVVAGGGLETLLTVSNRGTAVFNGTAFFRQGAGIEWNPIYNGERITNGQFAVSIAAKETKTYLITDSGFGVGGMLITAADDSLDLTNYVEASLTYFIKSGDVTVDSVGVLPATPFLASSLPFDDFNSITLAFVNSDFSQRTANITMTLYDDHNSTALATLSPALTMLPGEQKAKYLKEFFPSVSSLASGRLEIKSDIPVSGIAMTQTSSGQFSSLPLNSTIRTYLVHASDTDVGMTQIALWTNGPFVNGYLIMTYDNQEELGLVYGQLSGEGDNQTLNLHFDTNSDLTLHHDLVGFVKTKVGFNWSKTTFTGNYTVGFTDGSYHEDGTFTATLTIP